MFSHSSTRKLASLLVTLLLVAIGYALVHERYLTQTDYNAELSEQSKRDLLSITDQDHVYGSRDADVHIVLYSDAACQYCRWVYPTLIELVDSYSDGAVALVYRYLPIYQTRNTVSQSEIVGECVAEQLGDAGFFAYTKALFARLPKGQQLDSVPTTTTEAAIASVSGDPAGITSCVENFTALDRIRKNHSSGGALGVIRIPHTFIVNDETIWEINRAQPINVYRSAIENLDES